MNSLLEIFFNARNMHFFIIWTSRKSFIKLGHATDQKCHLGLIRLRIFKMRWISVANDHLGPKPLISDSATRRSLWPRECQPVALDDNEWQISKTLIQSSIQTDGQVSKKSYFDIWHFWKSYCWLRLIWGLDHRSRSRRSRYILPGAEAGAGAAKHFYSEPGCFPGAGAGAHQKCHGSASLALGNAHLRFPAKMSRPPLRPTRYGGVFNFGGTLAWVPSPNAPPPQKKKKRRLNPPVGETVPSVPGGRIRAADWQLPPNAHWIRQCMCLCTHSLFSTTIHRYSRSPEWWWLPIDARKSLCRSTVLLPVHRWRYKKRLKLYCTASLEGVKRRLAQCPMFNRVTSHWEC